MEKEELISKRDLLEETKISYGQLYRWKRMKIIPETWFIKKSSFTGQETYFPRKKILERIDKIIELKDRYSLTELAKFFSPDPTKIEVPSDVLINQRILKKETVELWESVLLEKGVNEHPYKNILAMYVVEQLAMDTLEQDDMDNALKVVQSHAGKLGEGLSTLLGLKKRKIVIWQLVPYQDEYIVDDATLLVAKVNVLECINELKLKLTDLNR